MGFDVQAAKQAGYSDDEINAFVKKQGITIDTPVGPIEQVPTPEPAPQQVFSNKLNKYSFNQKQLAELENEEVKDLSDLYKNVNSKYSTGAKSFLGWFSGEGAEGASPIGGLSAGLHSMLKTDEAKMQARREINQLNRGLVEKLAKEGFQAYLDPETGEPMYTNSTTGEAQPIDGSILNDLWNSKFETGGAIAGAIAGGQAMNLATAPLLPVTPPTAIAKGVAVAGGAIAGGMAGASAGRGLDLLNNSYAMKEKLEVSLAIEQMKEAAIYDGISGIIGGAAFKTLGYGWKTIAKAADLVAGGNRKGAEEALKRLTQLSDEQVDDIVTLVEKQSGKALPVSNPTDKKILATMTTQKGGETVVAQAVSQSPDIANKLKSTIDIRAKELIKTVDKVSGDDSGKLLKEQLGAYKTDVKDYYREVKELGQQVVDPTDYRFDVEKLALKPVLDSVRKNIGDNPNHSQQLADYIAKVEDTTIGRTFGDLIDLRQAMNDFKHTKLVSKTHKVKGKASEFDAVNEVINRIDTQIEKAAKTHMAPQQAEAWLKNFKDSKLEYAKMKQLEDNVLFKQIVKKGVTEQDIQRNFSKYIDSLDSTFLDVLDKVPPATRMKAEGAIVKHHIDKYTLGNTTDLQAIDYPMVAESLKNVNIKTPEAKFLKNSIEELARVYKNDVNLARVSGNIAPAKNPNYLTADPVTRIKFGIMTKVFNHFRKMLPGRQAANQALVNKLEKVLDNPLHVKTADDFIRSMPNESQAEMTSLVSELRKQMAVNPPTMPPNHAYMYQKNTPSIRTTNGEWGKGIYLVPQVADPKNVPLATRQLVDFTKLANMEDIFNILDKEVTAKEIRDNPRIQEILVDKGFRGIKNGDKVMMFPDSVMGVKKAMKPRAAATLDDLSNMMDRPITSADQITDEVKAMAMEKGFKGIEVDGNITKLGE